MPSIIEAIDMYSEDPLQPLSAAIIRGGLSDHEYHLIQYAITDITKIMTQDDSPHSVTPSELTLRVRPGVTKSLEPSVAAPSTPAEKPFVSFPVSRDEDWRGLDQKIRYYCPHNVRTGNSCPAFDMCRSTQVCKWAMKGKHTNPYTMKPCTLAHFLTTCRCMERNEESTCELRLRNTALERERHKFPQERKQLLAELPAHREWAEYMRSQDKTPATINQGRKNVNFVP